MFLFDHIDLGFKNCCVSINYPKAYNMWKIVGNVYKLKVTYLIKYLEWCILEK